MGRVIALILLIGGSLLLGGWLREQGLPIDPPSFSAGIGVTVVLGLIAFVIRVWWEHVTAPFRPQVVVHRTEQTPAQVMFNAYLWLFVGLALIGLFCVGGAYYLGLVWK